MILSQNVSRDFASARSVLSLISTKKMCELSQLLDFHNLYDILVKTHEKIFRQTQSIFRWSPTYYHLSMARGDFPNSQRFQDARSVCTLYLENEMSLYNAALGQCSLGATCQNW